MKRSTILGLVTLAGAIMGAFFGIVGSMWGGIQVILPATTILFGGAAYIAGRMTFAVIDANR